MAYTNTILNQVLSLISRPEFEALAEEYGIGRKHRTFSRWSQFVCLTFIHLSCRKYARWHSQPRSQQAAALSPRYRERCAIDICRRQCQAARRILSGTLRQALPTVSSRRSGGDKFRFKGKLFSFDSSTVKFCLSAFP